MGGFASCIEFIMIVCVCVYDFASENFKIEQMSSRIKGGQNK